MWPAFSCVCAKGRPPFCWRCFILFNEDAAQCRAEGTEISAAIDGPGKEVFLPRRRKRTDTDLCQLREGFGTGSVQNIKKDLHIVKQILL